LLAHLVLRFDLDPAAGVDAPLDRANRSGELVVIRFDVDLALLEPLTELPVVSARGLTTRSLSIDASPPLYGMTGSSIRVRPGDPPPTPGTSMIARAQSFFPASSSTSRVALGMRPWTNALEGSLIRRYDSAAILPKTSELLPDRKTPVNAVSRRFGMSTSTLRHLFSRAPRTPDQWVLSARWAVAAWTDGLSTP
jgi:hypothetical protein